MVPVPRRGIVLLASFVWAGCTGGFGRPPAGGEEARTTAQEAALAKLRGMVQGQIVWSSSRLGNHDIFVMNTDGSDQRAITHGDPVDWYPRFDATGKRILFTRSKRGWVAETEANRPEKWDLYVVNLDGTGERKVVDRASWGIWIGDEEILFARRTKVFTRALGGGAESLLVDSEHAETLGGAELQNPHLSPDRKYLAITLRGARRETGIFDLAAKSWVKTGEGCQINWFPAGNRILWVNSSGNGGSEVFSEPVTAGRPTQAFALEQLRFIDIPGRRSHEYFPQLDRSGKWLVWAATQYGHDHDIADYEIYIWPVGAPSDQATRLTFHSGNDRWPDIFVGASPR